MRHFLPSFPQFTRIESILLILYDGKMKQLIFGKRTTGGVLLGGLESVEPLSKTDKLKSSILFTF